MKILLAAGGTGGHFYPLVAVVRELRKIAESERIVSLDIVLVADKPIDKNILETEEIRYKILPTGKMRRYRSFWNITDIFKTAIAVFRGLILMYVEMPDVVFSKGGYAAFPMLFAARLYRIPVIIHESDSIPGKVNRWAAKFARRIAISFPDAAQFFPKDRTALTGNPVRTPLLGGNREESLTIFRLEGATRTVLILGGSQGAQIINEVLTVALPELVEEVQIIHQTGISNFDEVIKQSSVILESSEHKNRYHPFAFLEEDRLRSAAVAADVVVSRAGASAIFEIAAWGLPSILIPLPGAVDAQGHQRENAYTYARAGACEVIEQINLTPHVLIGEIRRLLEPGGKRVRMIQAAQAFSRLDAAEKIAREILNLGMHQGS